MFCKSGILIFIFDENNYSIYAHAMLIKTPLLHQSFGPHVLLSFFLSLSLSLRLFLWNTEVLCVHFPALASKTLSRRHSVLHPIERAPEASVNRASPVQGLYWLSVQTKEYQLLSLSFTFLSVDSTPPGSGPLKDLKKWGPEQELDTPRQIRME